MKYCPVCQTKYDEEILRFCTKDGTPLIDENQPSFTALPSESDKDDFSEETVIRRNQPENSAPDIEEKRKSSERIVIPTGEIREEPQVRAKPAVIYQPPPREPNTAKLVVTTILGTLIILGSVGGIFWVLSNQNADDGNRNVNTNLNPIESNVNTNLNIDNSPMDLNLNANSDLDANVNANVIINLRTPTPTPTRTPTPTPVPTPTANTNTNTNNSNVNTPTPNVNIRPANTPSSTPRPTPSSTPPGNRPVNAGVLNGRAINLPKPAYPPIAKQVRAAGQVAVQVAIDELGNVTSAKATSGHLLLRAPAEAAARQSKINPVKVGNKSVQATGILLYTFINQ